MNGNWVDRKFCQLYSGVSEFEVSVWLISESFCGLEYPPELAPEPLSNSVSPDG